MIQLALDLIFHPQPLLKKPRRKRLVKKYGKRPNQFTFNFKLISTKKSLFKRFATQFFNTMRKIKSCITHFN